MRKMIYTTLAAAAGIMMLAGCGSKPAETAAPTAAAAETTAAPETRADQNEAETEAETKEAEAACETPVNLHPIAKSLSYWGSVADDVVWLNYSASAEGALLDEDEAKTYPELAKALEEGLKDQADYACAAMNEMNATIIDMRDGGFPFDEMPGMELYDRKRTYVTRADSVAVSQDIYLENYYGGVHGYYSHCGLVIDAKTGKELKLSDVAADMDGLKAAIKAELLADYGEDIEEVSIDAYLDDYFDSDTQGLFPWTLGYNGLTIYCNPYTIGAYASGAQIVTITFAEYPELIKEQYRAVPENYVIPLFEESAWMDLDVDGDGTEDRITVMPVYGSEGEGDFYYSYINAFRIMINGTETEFDTYSYDYRPYFVKNGDGFYIYIWSRTDNDYILMNVYDITGGRIRERGYYNIDPSLLTWENIPGSAEHASENEYMTRTAVFADPQHMQMDSRLNALSTYTGTRIYYVSEDGTPKSDEDFLCQWGGEVTTIADLEVEVTDETGTASGETEMLPAGTVMKFYRTDGDTYVIFCYNGDSYGRVTVDTTVYPQLINGVDQEEELEGTMYAG